MLHFCSPSWLTLMYNGLYREHELGLVGVGAVVGVEVGSVVGTAVGVAVGGIVGMGVEVGVGAGVLVGAGVGEVDSWVIFSI